MAAARSTRSSMRYGAPAFADIAVVSYHEQRTWCGIGCAGSGHNFLDAGDTIIGVDGGTMKASYGDIDTPPMHPDCRCYLRPEDIKPADADEASGARIARIVPRRNCRRWREAASKSANCSPYGTR